MDATKLLKKLVSYLILIVAGFGFVYFILLAGLNLYTNGRANPLTADSLQQYVILPVIFSFLCLLVLGLDQFLMVKVNDANEKRLYSIGLLVYFGALLGYTLVFFIRSLTSQGTMLSLLAVPCLAAELAEITLGIIKLISAQKELTSEGAAAEQK